MRCPVCGVLECPSVTHRLLYQQEMGKQKIKRRKRKDKHVKLHNVW